MRILTWNCRRASSISPLWEVLEDLSPDVALLQEIGGLPTARFGAYERREVVPRTQAGTPQRFSTAILSRLRIGRPVTLTTRYAWINTQLAAFAGNVLGFEVMSPEGNVLRVVNVYSPAWPLDPAAYTGEDVTGVKLEQNPEIWLTDLVTAALQHSRPHETEDWIVAGDFNSCVTFDSWQGGPRGNQEWLDRMAALGFIECLRSHQGRMVPTFRRPGRPDPHCQIDKLFASRALAARLTTCWAEPANRVYDQGLSDHLPVVADFTP